MPYADPELRKKKARGYTARYRAKNKECPQGVCSNYPNCHNPAEDGFVRCRSCCEYMRLYKKGVLRGRSPERDCLVCGNPSGGMNTRCVGCRVDPRAPERVHIDGKGAAHRREIGTGNKTGNFYGWLRKNNFPPGLRILRMNCNWSSRHSPGNICAHQRSSA